MTDVFVGLGSNLGNRVALLSQAIGAMADLPETHVVDYSHAYESKPWGVEDQPLFVNAVAWLRTDLRADQLLEQLQEIETRLGRTHEKENGPRTMDLDILLFGEEESQTDDLVIPHPRMAERDFVITPLLEIAPDVLWPEGTPVTRDAVRVGEVLRDLGPIPDAGVAEGVPVHAGEWETVGSGVTMPPDLGLGFKQMVLEQAGIPFAWDPYPPSDEYQPFGLPMPVSLKVPAEFAARARTLIAQAEQAPMEDEPMDFGPEEPESEPEPEG